MTTMNTRNRDDIIINMDDKTIDGKTIDGKIIDGKTIDDKTIDDKTMDNDRVFVIGDLHFSYAVNKPMDVFGENWIEHDKKILDDWQRRVGKEDTVLILGDISWASKMDDAKADLDVISSMNGKKVLIRGNHDYWWTSVSKLNKLYDDMRFLGTDYYAIGSTAIVSARGWLCPNDTMFTDDDMKIYLREVGRMKLSIDAARKDGYDSIIAIMHYPPTNDKWEDSGFTELFEEHGVKNVFYGHLHGEESFKIALLGDRNGVNYQLVSADFLGFRLKEIEVE